MWLQALKDREEAVRNGKLTTIVFIRDKNAKGQEVRALGRGTRSLHVNFAAVVMGHNLWLRMTLCLPALTMPAGVRVH